MDIEKIGLALLEIQDKVAPEDYASSWYKFSIGNKLPRANSLSLYNCYTFIYNAEKKAPWFDTHPLIYLLGIHGRTFLGLNLHHMTDFYKRKLITIDILSKLNNGTKADYYNILLSKDIVRQYRFDRIRPSVIWSVDPLYFIEAVSTVVDTMQRG